MRVPTLVVLLIVLAGCGGASSEPRSPVVTPAPLPATETRAGQVIGNWESGIDPNEIASAHGEALTGSYTVSANQTIVGPSGSVRADRRMRLKLAADHTRFHVELSVAGPNAIGLLGEPPARAEFWSANGTRILRAFTTDNHTSYNAFSPRLSQEVGLVGTAGYWERVVLPGGQPEEDIAPLLRHLSVKRDETDRDLGPGQYRLRSENFRDPAAFARAESFHVSNFLGNAHNVSFTAVVGRDGLVRQYRLAYSGRIDDTPVRVVRTIRFRNVGTTTVPRPPWYEQAPNGTEVT